MIELISPAGVRVRVIWLAPFAKQHGLDPGNLYRVAMGQRQHHKGWRSAIPPIGFSKKPQALEKHLTGAAQ